MDNAASFFAEALDDIDHVISEGCKCSPRDLDALVVTAIINGRPYVYSLEKAAADEAVANVLDTATAALKGNGFTYNGPVTYTDERR